MTGSRLLLAGQQSTRSPGDVVESAVGMLDAQLRAHGLAIELALADDLPPAASSAVSRRPHITQIHPVDL